MLNHFNNTEHFLLNYKFPINYGRKKVHNNPHCFSITMGIIQELKEREDLLENRNIHKELWDILDNFKNQTKYANFRYSAITVNKNLKCLPHKDNNNTGNSIIIGFGDYINGELILYDDNNKITNKLNIKHKWVMFNAGEITHSVNKFIGNRITVVYHS